MVTSNKSIRYWLISLLLLTTGTLQAQTWTPKTYYTFENISTPMKDSISYFNLDPAYYQSGYSIQTNSSGTGVGRYMKLDSTGNMIRGGVFDCDTSFTIELLYKPGYYVSPSTQLFRRLDGAIDVRFGYPFFEFNTYVKANAGGYINDNFIVTFDGTGRKSYGYYIDNNWHHIVFKYSAKTGVKEIWVDGQCPSGFSKTTATGYFENTSGNRDLIFNTGTSYIKLLGAIDEVATYWYGLPSNQIYKHYQDFQNHNHYTFANSSTPAPNPSPVSAGINIAEYAPGHPNPNVSVIDQIKNFPNARFKPGHTLLPNQQLFGLTFLSGFNTYYGTNSVALAQSIAMSKTLQTDFVNNFNYAFLVAGNTGDYTNVNDTNTFTGAWIKMGNQNPQWKTAAFSFWPQIHPNNAGFKSSTRYIECGCLPNSSYLQNSSGSFLDLYGNTTSNKWLAPDAPRDSIYQDGLTQRFYMQTLLNKMTRPLDLIFENGEVMPFYNNGTVLGKDPSVTSDKNSTGLDWYTYESKRNAEKVKAYRDQFMNLGGLANTKFVWYYLDGHPQWNLKWTEMKSINTTINGMTYASGDIYPRWPNNWRNWTSAWKGWQWVAETRHEQLATGDKLFSPAVSPGWDNNEELNMRPAQWLGFLKAVSMTGAEFFYTGYFSTQVPYQDPKNWVWQTVIPPYVQAISSRYEDFFRNGYLMSGDVPNSSSNPQWNAYSFYAGDPRKLVVIRKHNALTKYAITGTIQPMSNMDGSTELSGTAQINLDGQVLKFTVRRQGSTYIYDKTDASNPVFYQLDGWHENIYPYNWSKDFNLEAEVFDNNNSNVSLKTRRPSSATSGDYTNYTTSVSFNAATDVLYYFQPRASANANYYFWVLARVKSAGQTSAMNISLDGGATKQIGCVNDTNWVWYRYNMADQQPVTFANLATNVTHNIRITSTNANLEIDKILLSTNSGTLFANPAPCSSIPTPTITPSGSTTFCQGGNVTLTSSSGNSYQWSTGATSQSITVSVSGTYTVTVTTAQGSGTSTPVTVTVNPLPAATISASGATTFCQGGSVTLTASSGSSYLWTPGNQTSQTLAVTASGNYTVRVTNSNGCSATSSPTSVTVNAAPASTITPSGPTTFCQGGNVTLTGNSLAGATYLWLPGNQTTQSVTATASGNYTVKVTDSKGCTSTSAVTAVTVNSLPASTISANGPLTFAPGGSVTLTASSGSSYLWLPGNQTSQSINVTSSGSYTVRVTNSNGCSATSAATIVTVTTGTATPTITASGPLSFCSGQSVTLTSSPGISYLWSNGATTQSITVNAGGNYSVTVVTASGTGTSAPTTVTVVQNPLPNITASGPTTFCSGGSVTLTSTAGAQYLWTPGNQTVQSITVSSAGSYSVRLTNASGCSGTSAVTTVNVNPNPSATISANGPLTFNAGGSVVLTANTSSSYYWLPGGQTTKSITVTASGSYTVRTTNSYGCSTTSAPTIVTVNSGNATISAGGPTTFCSGSDVTLTASPGTSYQWSTGETTQSILVTTSGSYIVTVFNGLFSSSTSSPMNVTVNPQPTANITAGGATTVCSPATVILTATANTSYLWSNGATTQAITVATTGNYSVTVTNSFGCTKTSNATSVTVNNCSGTCSPPTGLWTNNITANSAELHWSAVPADSFFVKLRNLNTGYNYFTSAMPNIVTSITVGASSSTNYRWWVRSKCGATKSVWSAFASFTTPAVRVTNDPDPKDAENYIPVEQEIDAEDDFQTLYDTYQSTPVNEFVLMPNPATSETKVNYKAESAGSAKAYLRDLSGRIINEYSWSFDAGLNIYTVDLRNLPKGVYLININNDNGIQTTKRLVVN